MDKLSTISHEADLTCAAGDALIEKCQDFLDRNPGDGYSQPWEVERGIQLLTEVTFHYRSLEKLYREFRVFLQGADRAQRGSRSYVKTHGLSDPQPIGEISHDE